MALCALVATLSRMQRIGRSVQVVGLSRQFKQYLESLDLLAGSLHLVDSDRNTGYQEILHAYRVKSEQHGNEVGNKIATEIASLIPSQQPATSALEPPPRVNSVFYPLAYIFTELIDNALRHGRGRGFNHASVCLSAQYHPPRGLIRLAVVDDGCGFLATFQGRSDIQVKSHAEAIRTGFKPYTSSKRDVGLFSDTQHQGLGLTICRDLALRSEGSVAVVSGNSWITNPEAHDEHSRIAPFWRGAALSVELRLPALNTVNFFEITSRYNPDPNLPIRFI
jgi:signal transduction histidine kinase